MAIAATVLAFAPGWLDAFAPLKAALLGACAAAIATAAIARGTWPRDGVAVAALATLGMVGASAWWARDRALAWRGELEQREGVLTWAALVVLFLGARAAHAAVRDRERTRAAIVGVALAAAAYALAQFAGLDFVAWGDAARYASGGGESLRPGATLGNPIQLGAVLAPAFAILVAQLAARRGDVLVQAAAAALLGAALAATLSRGAQLAALAGALVAVRVAKPSPRRAAVALAAALAPAVAWSAFALRGAPLARFLEGEGASSGGARVELARAALRLWREHPLLGVGPDNFGLAFPTVQSPEYWSRVWLGTPAHAHSAPLQALATLGVLGALALAAWGALALAPLVLGRHERAERAALAGALAACGVAAVFNPLGIAGATVFVVLLALASASGVVAATPARERRGLSPAAAAMLAVTAALASLAAAWPALAPLADAGRARAALEASVKAGRDDARAALAGAAASAADAALARQPADDEPWRLAADAHLAAARAAGDTLAARRHAESALAAARGATARAPLRATNALREALAIAANGGDARAAFERAARLAPVDALVLGEDARDALTRDDATRAAECARRIVALYPRAAHGHALAGAAALRGGDRAGAREAFRRALAAEWEEGSDRQRAAVADLLAALARDSAAAH